MASLQEIKSRIYAVKKIKKITKAMQLVATAKLIKAKKKWEEVQVYYYEIYEVFNKLLKKINNLDKIFEETKYNKSLYVILTSDLGLCGSYNYNILKLAKKHLKPKDEIIVIGTKGVSAFKDTNYKIINSFEDVSDDHNYLVASKIAKNIVIKFLEKEIKNVKIVYTKYINSISYDSKIINILPIKIDKEKIISNQEIEFEPNPKIVMINSLPLYISAILYSIMAETKVAEMSSRRLAMENASDNADELIDNLNLKYNRIRQAKITQEIAEILTGSEADLE